MPTAAAPTELLEKRFPNESQSIQEGRQIVKSLRLIDKKTIFQHNGLTFSVRWMDWNLRLAGIQPPDKSRMAGTAG
jgi:hypothetical protein